MRKEKLPTKPVVIENIREPVDEVEENNPFLLNLPPLARDDREAEIQSKSIFADSDGFTDEDRKKSKAIRSVLLSRIMNNFFFPLPWHAELSKRVDRLLFAAYDRIDPFDEKRRNEKQRKISAQDFGIPEGGKGIDTAAFGYSLIGFSGAGKTSALDMKLRPLRKVYEIRSFRGKEFCAYQMPVLLVKCPDSGSIKDLVDAIFREVYERTSLEMFNIQVKRSNNIDDYVEKIAHILTFLNVGLICIDDADNIAAMTRDKQRLTRFISHLMNSVETSFLFVGTEEVYKIISVEYSRRRMTTGNVIKAEYFTRNDPGRRIFAESIWKNMSILNTENKYTDQIDDIIYTATLGSPAGFKMVCAEIQEKALNTGDERITIEMVEECARDYMSLRREDRKKILTTPLESYNPDYEKALPENVDAESLVKEARRFGYNLPEAQLRKICEDLALRFPGGSYQEAKDLLVMTLNRSFLKGAADGQTS